jgi:CheY-like chemotaxis protein
MPETDGGEVAARIESDPTLHRMPVVFLTALVTKAEARSGLQIQGHPFLAKPISIPELVAAIERHRPAHASIVTVSDLSDLIRQIDGDRWIPRRGVEKFS